MHTLLMSKKLTLMPPPAALEEQGSLNPLDQLLGYQLRRASVAMLADLGGGLAALDLRVTEASVLMVIGANPDITQSEVCRVLSIQRANMVPLATQLERRGLIHKGAAIGRAQALCLTQAGRKIVRECQERIAAHEARFLDGLTKEQSEALITQIRRIWDR